MNREGEGPLRRLYEQYARRREPFLASARACAKYTIPALMPPAGHGSNHLRSPHQGMGAMAVNGLTAKIMMALFPPAGSFFRLTATAAEMEMLIAKAADGLAASAGADPREVSEELRARATGEVEEALSRYERDVLKAFERQGARQTDSEGIRQLIVGGNFLRYQPPGGGEKPRIYRLDQYVVRRDPDGRVLDILTREGTDVRSLPAEVIRACGLEEAPDGVLGEERECEIYTRIQWVPARAEAANGFEWRVEQELNGHPIPDRVAHYLADECPWLPVRWTKLDGEDYGRSYVSEHLGALIHLDALSEAIADGATASARVLVLVNPNGTTKLRDVANAGNGAAVPGNAADVTFLQAQKAADLRVAMEQAAAVRQELAQVFLLNSALQRNAERVTATEIRMLAQELETTLGGVYSMLAQEFQLPLLRLVIAGLQREGLAPALPRQIQPTILTGVESMGRTSDLERLNLMMQMLSPLPPAEVVRRVNVGEFIQRVAAAVGVETDNLIRPEEEVQAEIQQQLQAQQAMEMVNRLGPATMQLGAKAMEQDGGAGNDGT